MVDRWLSGDFYCAAADDDDEEIRLQCTFAKSSAYKTMRNMHEILRRVFAVDEESGIILSARGDGEGIVLSRTPPSILLAIHSSICLSTRTAVHSHIHQSILQSDSPINHLSVNASIRPCLLVEFFPFLFHVIVLIPPSLRSFPPLYSVADPEGEEIRSWTLIQFGCRF